MAYRQNADWREGSEGEENSGENINHGNTRLPFGLCQRYGIAIGDNWTPRDAWNALKGKGVEPKQVYEKLDKENEKTEKEEKIPLNEYVGTGQADLQNTLKAKLPNSANSRQVIDMINRADGKSCELLNNYFRGNPKAQIKLGRNLKSEYFPTEQKIQVGAHMFNEYYSGDYAEGQTFFHECGHAIDDTYKVTNGYGRGYWSSNYVSPKYQMTMSDMIKAELVADSNLRAKLRAEIDGDISEEHARVRQQLGEIEPFAVQRKTQLEESFKSRDKELDEVRENLYRDLRSGAIDINVFSQKKAEYDRARTELRSEKATAYANDVILQQYNAILDKNRRFEREKAHRDNVRYGDLSDMLEASTGNRLTGMGHNYVYFFGRNGAQNRGTEAFAEITSARAVNSQSYEQMKKHIPKTIEIYEEILKEIENGRQQIQNA